MAKKKKPITINLNADTVNKLDRIRKHSKVHTTRTMLIEDILEQFIKMQSKFKNFDWEVNIYFSIFFINSVTDLILLFDITDLAR